MKQSFLLILIITLETKRNYGIIFIFNFCSFHPEAIWSNRVLCTEMVIQLKIKYIYICFGRLSQTNSVLSLYFELSIIQFLPPKRAAWVFQNFCQSEYSKTLDPDKCKWSYIHSIIDVIVSLFLCCKTPTSFPTLSCKVFFVQVVVTEGIYFVPCGHYVI